MHEIFDVMFLQILEYKYSLSFVLWTFSVPDGTQFPGHVMSADRGVFRFFGVNFWKRILLFWGTK